MQLLARHIHSRLTLENETDCTNLFEWKLSSMKNHVIELVGFLALILSLLLPGFYGQLGLISISNRLNVHDGNAFATVCRLRLRWQRCVFLLASATVTSFAERPVFESFSEYRTLELLIRWMQLLKVSAWLRVVPATSEFYLTDSVNQALSSPRRCAQWSAPRR